MNRRWIIIGALALLVAGAVYLFFARLEQKATVVVATRDLPAGTRLQETDIAAQVIHASGAQTGVYSDTQTLIGRKLRSPACRATSSRRAPSPRNRRRPRFWRPTSGPSRSTSPTARA